MNINRAQLKAIADGVLDKLGEDPNKYDPSNLTLEEQILLAAANEIVGMLRQSLIDKKGVASGDLLQSLDTSNATRSGDTITVNILAAPHWKAFEYGTPKGTMPRIKDIEEWITAKGISIRRSKSESKQSVLERRHSLAVAIAKKIYARGTIQRFGYKGSNFVQDVLTDDNLQQIGNILGEKYGMKLAIYLTAED